MSVFSRVAALTGRSLFRAGKSASYLAFVKPQYLASARYASTQSAVKSELIDALENEIRAEENLENDNLGGSNRPSITGFQISTNQAEVRLTKNFGSEKILVVFNVNHSVDVDEDEGNPDSAPVPLSLPPFSIEITKGSQRLCFNMSLVEAGDEGQFDFRVEEFYIAPSAKGESEDVPDQVYASSGRYIDPSLHDILFVKYLEERGIDEAFCGQLVDYATHYVVMPRTVNKLSANARKAISNEADRDLRNLGIARERVEIFGEPPQKRVRRPTNERDGPSSSDDSESDTDEQPRPKMPRVVQNVAEDTEENDVVVVGEFVPLGEDSTIQLNLASDEILIDDEATENNTSTENEHNSQNSIAGHTAQDNLPNAITYENDEDKSPTPTCRSELVDFLSEEIKEESRQRFNQREPKINGFVVISKHQAEVKLSRKVNDEHIQVLANINNSLYLPSEEAIAPVSIPNFTVELLKDTSRLCFNVTLEKSEDDFFEIQVESFYHLNIDRSEPNHVASGGSSSTVYQTFNKTFPQGLQDKLQSYLEDQRH
ncbi:Conserved regulator of innate immunity protein 3 [Aphelenchoides bicaudatus]|nr:Conserved regulator of innate immunity protein 3 [Aphelenchoides bicaudatus]